MTPEFEKIENILRHIHNVQQNCLLLGKRLIEDHDEIDLGRMLIANGLIHDNSKFFGVEWQNLINNEETEETEDDKRCLELSIYQHNRTNSHHPEYWGGIKNMPRLYVAEMVADWKARSNEFGSSLQEWIDKDASKRFGYKKKDPIYEQIMYFSNILCDKPFVKLEEE
jgi:hypothetical protein